MKTCNKDFIKEKGLPKGDALSLPKGDALSLPKGDALSLPKGDALSLPKGWEVKKLGEVCDILDKLRKPITKRNRVEGEYPYYGATGILSYVHEYIFDEKLVLIGEDGAKWKSGDNSSFIVSGKYWVNNHAHVIRPIRNSMLDEWVVNFLNFSDLTQYITGMTVPKLNQKKMKNIPIPLPPLPEQKRIVSILDQAFTAIDKAKANTEKNLKNARELFQSKLQETFANGKLKIDNGEWEEKKLGEVCLIERGSSPRPIKKYFTSGEDGVNWIKIGDTKGVDKYIYSTRQKITKEGAKKSRHVQAGDFILSNSMSYGKPYIMKTDGYIHDGWFVLRLHHFVDTEYFFQLLSSPYVNNQFHNLASGSVVKNINGDLVKKVILPIPPLPEQKQIVKQLDAVSIETKKLEAIYQRKINCLDELKKSILQKAFNGEL